MTGFHSYDRGRLAADAARATAGLVLTAAPLLVFDVHQLIAAFLFPASLLFVLFLVRTAIRASTRYELAAEGFVGHGPFAKTIRWDELDRMRLRYFSTRRDRRQGWMELKLTDRHGRSMMVESTLGGFELIAERALEAAVAKDLPIDRDTESNLVSMGLVMPKDGLAARWGVHPPGPSGGGRAGAAG